MPSKTSDNASKKTVQKKKEKVLEDKTFGLKNKNKSSKVQAYIKSTEKSIMNAGDPKQRQKDEVKKQAKLAAKARKKAEQQERDALFNEALLAVSKPTTTKISKGAGDAKGRDFDDDEKQKAGTSRAMKLMYQMDAQEASAKLREDPNYVATLEDEIELKRQQMFEAIKKRGQVGTPVTEETLNIWLEKKRKRRAEEAKKRVEAEMKKRKGGKGLSILSGRDLFEYKRELFADRDDDDDDDNNNDDGGGYGDYVGKEKDREAASINTIPEFLHQSANANAGTDALSLGDPANKMVDELNHTTKQDYRNGTKNSSNGEQVIDTNGLQHLTEKVQEELFLSDDDDVDLDDIGDDDDD